jgi:hypothetical protein
MSPASDNPNPMERRLVLRLLKYWRDIGGAEKFPAVGDVDAAAIPDMWPHCALLEVTGHERDPLIRHIGEGLANGCDGSLQGRALSVMPGGTLAAHAMSYYAQVLVKHVPITYGGEFRDRDGGKVLYRSIILPLADDGATIDRLLCAANCRVVAQN